jgi:hypothetical protein
MLRKRNITNTNEIKTKTKIQWHEHLQWKKLECLHARRNVWWYQRVVIQGTWFTSAAKTKKLIEDSLTFISLNYNQQWISSTISDLLEKQLHWKAFRYNDNI